MVAKPKKSRKSKSKAQPEPEQMDVAHIKEEVGNASAKKQNKKTKASNVEKTQSKEVTKSKKKKTKDEEPPPAAESSSGSEEEGEDDMKLTLEALDAMSDDDSDDDGSGDDGEGGEDEYDAEALALRQMIQDGKFDKLLKNHAKKSKEKKQQGGKKSKQEESESESENEGVEEAVLDASMENAEDEDEEGESENEEQEGGTEKAQPEQEDEEEESDSEDEDEDQPEATSKQTTQSIALTTALAASNRHLPWAETFAVVPPTPLPFAPPAAMAGTKRKLSKTTTVDGVEYDEDFVNEDEEEYVDIHDDLKREVAFYDNALEAVTLAREQCEKVGIPFTRPEDFFAEMVKSDDHMAKIKDRLIFETKKMEAVERRKSNKEQTVMAKERHAHRLAEKAKAKKAHMTAVDEWKKNAERSRSGLGGRVRDWQDDEDQLRGMSGGANKKRMAANKRYGFGGKRGRFKQNDSKTLNDMSGYNPRGGFGGVGQKSQSGKGKKGGKKRPGKRARDAARG